MRKIALLTVPLLILGLVSVSADPMEMMEPGPTAEVSGNATLTWGIDLETNATGFRAHGELISRSPSSGAEPPTPA